MTHQLATIAGIEVWNASTCPDCSCAGELDRKVTGASNTAIAQLSVYRCDDCLHRWVAVDLVDAET